MRAWGGVLLYQCRSRGRHDKIRRVLHDLCHHSRHDDRCGLYDAALYWPPLELQDLAGGTKGQKSRRRRDTIPVVWQHPSIPRRRVRVRALRLVKVAIGDIELVLVRDHPAVPVRARSHQHELPQRRPIEWRAIIRPISVVNPIRSLGTCALHRVGSGTLGTRDECGHRLLPIRSSFPAEMFRERLVRCNPIEIALCGLNCMLIADVPRVTVVQQPNLRSTRVRMACGRGRDVEPQYTHRLS
mmetsp:Transcript_59512/g.132515  ORF Transcript_59512/g.132515 Transcript_59512/m.132515 type:complete len:242 (+) Transcript_59512:229-954(+)